MRNTSACKFRNHKSSLIYGLVGLVALTIAPLFGQQPAALPGVPYDWSHHHLVFSQPKSSADASKIQQDPRYWQQLSRRTNSALSAQAAVKGQKQQISKDWNQNLGSTTAKVGAGNFPAKYSFSSQNFASSANCATDYVVFNTGADGLALTQASVTGTFTGDPSNGQTVVIGGAETLTASAPTPETATITIGSTKPASGSSVQIGSITYTFGTGSSVSTPTSTNACEIRAHSNDSTTQIATNLYDAIATSGSGSGSTFLCHSGSNPNSAVTATQPGSSTTIDLTSVTAGTAGDFTFTETSSPSPNLSTFSSSPGTDATNTGTSFAVGSGATTDATNL